LVYDLTEIDTDFHAHEIFRIVEPPIPFVVFGTEPIVPNHGD
jgi:hypothetical protein